MSRLFKCIDLNYLFPGSVAVTAQRRASQILDPPQEEPPQQAQNTNADVENTAAAAGVPAVLRDDDSICFNEQPVLAFPAPSAEVVTQEAIEIQRRQSLVLTKECWGSLEQEGKTREDKEKPLGDDEGSEEDGDFQASWGFGNSGSNFSMIIQSTKTLFKCWTTFEISKHV